jgi:hypothetical protein
MNQQGCSNVSCSRRAPLFGGPRAPRSLLSAQQFGRRARRRPCLNVQAATQTAAVARRCDLLEHCLLLMHPCTPLQRRHESEQVSVEPPTSLPRLWRQRQSLSWSFSFPGCPAHSPLAVIPKLCLHYSLQHSKFISSQHTHAPTTRHAQPHAAHIRRGLDLPFPFSIRRDAFEQLQMEMGFCTLNQQYSPEVVRQVSTAPTGGLF